MREPVTKHEQSIALQIRDLSKTFGSLTAVDNISFDILRNEIFGLLGPNGAGKTTTISMICGLIPATAGSIHLSNTGTKNPKYLIGYCPQENIYYPKLTCLEQMMFVGRIYGLDNKIVRMRANELLNTLGLGDKVHKMADSLSGGMKRRLNICLAIIHDPEILILDEPEAGLDPQSRLLVRDFIKTFGKKKTVILTTHNMDEADRLADRIAILDHGRLLMLDSPTNLKKTIGEGDILEIDFENGHSISLGNFTEHLASLSMNVKKTAGSVLVKHPDIVRFLPEIKNTAESLGLIIIEYRLRENTLEDVFINLTGRSLRQ